MWEIQAAGARAQGTTKMCKRWPWRYKWPWETRNVTSPVLAGRQSGVHKSHHCPLCDQEKGPLLEDQVPAQKHLGLDRSMGGRSSNQGSSTLWLWCELQLRECPAPSCPAGPSQGNSSYLQVVGHPWRWDVGIQPRPAELALPPQVSSQDVLCLWNKHKYKWAGVLTSFSAQKSMREIGWNRWGSRCWIQTALSFLRIMDGAEWVNQEPLYLDFSSHKHT